MTTAKNLDHLNRLQSIVSSVGSNVVSSHAYVNNSADQRTRATLADGSYWIYTYDDFGQVIGGNRYWADGQPVAGQQFGYSFDGIGNRTGTVTTGGTAGYAPNALNQYTERDVPGTVDVIGSAASTATVTINGTSTTRHGTYFAGTVAVSNTAAVNKSVTIVGVKAGAGANGEDVVTTSTGAIYVAKDPEVFTHDLDGNLTNDGRWTYTWDAENRLIQLETGTAAMASGTAVVTKQKLTFKYDWQGRRCEKVLSQWNTGTEGYETVATTRFLYDGWNLIAELDGNNNLLRSYFWGLDLSGSPQGAGGVGGLLSLTLTGSNAGNYSAFYDGNGNVMGMLGASGSLASIYEYGPFGEPIRVSAVMAGQNPIRFSTNYTDKEWDGVYGKRRFYNSSVGRWGSRDPASERGGYNLYAALLNNPPNYIDSLGLTANNPATFKIHFNHARYTYKYKVEITGASGYSPKDHPCRCKIVKIIQVGRSSTHNEWKIDPGDNDNSSYYNDKSDESSLVGGELMEDSPGLNWPGVLGVSGYVDLETGMVCADKPDERRILGAIKWGVTTGSKRSHYPTDGTYSAQAPSTTYTTLVGLPYSPDK